MIAPIICIVLAGSISTIKTEQITKCSSSEPLVINAVLDLEGDIYSPGYEKGQYPEYAHCTYIIRGPSRHKIKLTFKMIDVEPYDFCNTDRINIYDGIDTAAPFLATLCGSELPRPIVSGRNGIYIHFNSDYMGSGKGYHIHYEVSPNVTLCPSGLNECGNRNCYKPQDRCNGKDDCGDGTDEENCGLPLATTQCGQNPVTSSSGYADTDRIIGGNEVKRGQWPWQADLQYRHYHPNSHICGAALLNPQWILTAIHCLAGAGDPKTWRIHLGNHDKFSTEPYEQIRYVERIIIYPGYTGPELIGKGYSLDHDMALMKLSAPVEITDYVRPVCLPKQGQQLPLKTQCYSTGWGTTRGTGAYRYLKEVKMSVRNGTECNVISTTRQQTRICVKNDEGFQDVCHGDSGGPLNCKLGDKWHVMGVASYVTTSNLLHGLCGTPGSGAVYNMASEKRDWIDEMMQKYS